MNDAGEAMDEIEDVIGFIDPSEPVVIQNLRRAVRARQDTLKTERVYVSNVKAFKREWGLRRHHLHRVRSLPAGARRSRRRRLTSTSTRMFFVTFCYTSAACGEKLLSETD